VRLRGRLLSIARHITGNDDDAADILQEAFCRLWQRQQGVTTRNEVEGMSVVTVRNMSIDVMRRRHAHPSVELIDHDAIAEDDTSWQQREQLYQQLHAIIDNQLTTAQQRIVTMRELEGRSFDDIATEMGMSVTAVRMQLSRARKIVRQCYRRKEELL